MYNSKDVSLIATAFTLANTSKSIRRKCGCIVVRKVNNRYMIIGSGVNGTSPGSDNTCENEDLSMTLPHVIHAEINATRDCDFKEGDVIYITDSPCESCLRILEDIGYKKIFYCRGYRITDHLKDSHMEYVHIPWSVIQEHFKETMNSYKKVIC